MESNNVAKMNMQYQQQQPEEKKFPLSIQTLESVGVSENCLDATISTLEKIGGLLTRGTYEWTNPPGTNAKLHRLKWASKNLASKIICAEKGLNWRNKCRRKEISQLISDQSGIVRLRQEKSVKTRKLYGSGDENPEGKIKFSPAPKPLNYQITQDQELQEIKNEVSSEDHFTYPTPQFCYVCKKGFTKVHTFYDQLCPPCAELNFNKRSQSANMSGKVALVTGGRIKIGYEVVLKLLRCGISRVIVTTRFPSDAAKRFAAEPDSEDWKDRLDIYGLDLRFLGAVESFCNYVCKNYDRLDILIQNAAQTVRRPPAFYAHLIREEIAEGCKSPMIKAFQKNSITHVPMSILDSGQSALNFNNPFALAVPNQDQYKTVPCSASALASQLIVHPNDNDNKNSSYFPQGQFDSNHQQVDLRPRNSWLLETPEVKTTELVEVSIVNSIAPFTILSKLTPLLKKSANKNSSGWIILVSAMEGQFYRQKTSRHPHTNCAKASLNMLVRTSSSYYAQFGLLMSAVDTGWVTDEVPLSLQNRRKRRNFPFVPPLDEIDGAARILDPIFQSIHNPGVKEFGKFYKDYKETSW